MNIALHHYAISLCVQETSKRSHGTFEERYVNDYVITLEAFGTQIINTNTVCKNWSCSFFYSVSSLNTTLIRGNVAARNVFGHGEMCNITVSVTGLQPGIYICTLQ